MVIDSHYHYMRLPNDETAAREMAAGLLLDAERAGIKKSVDEAFPILRDYMDDLECDKLVKRMDESGIGITVIVVVDNRDFGFSDEQILRFNERCANAAAKHAGRIIALAGIEPRRTEAPALLRKCITEFGMKGLKWHPDFGFYPNSEESYAVLEVASELGVPLLTHTGPLAHNKAKYAHPIHLDDIAEDFPNLNIIAAHMGDVVWRDWAALAKYKRNIYGDLAMWQFPAVVKPDLFRRNLREMLDIVGPEQVLFATDGPGFEPCVSNKDWVELIRTLSKESSDGIKFTDEEVEAILHGNAARIFKL